MRQYAAPGDGPHDRAPRARDLGRRNGPYADASGTDGTGGGAGAGRGPRSGGHGAGHGRSGPEGSGGGTGGRRPGGAVRVLRWVALSLSVLVLGTAGAGYLYYEHLNGNLTRKPLTLGGDQLKHRQDADGRTPINILLLGSDSRNSTRNVELGGARDKVGDEPLADVQMLLHLSADRDSISVLSIPRDTRVTIPECTDPEDDTVHPRTIGKINTSLQHGGPGCTVATWGELTGIPIDHFMMIDFAGVVDMADAVGGVPVCVRANVHDPNSGLRLEKGETTVRGEQALQWLRTRYGFGDGTDIGRARAQHMYMNSMVRQLKAGTKLTDAGKLRALAEAATEALTVDDGIEGVKDLYDLANELKKVPTDRISMATMPWEYAAGGDYVVPKPGEAEQVFSLIRDDVALDGKDPAPKKDTARETRDPAAPEERITVRVLNGTRTAALGPVNGRAGAVADELRRLGFTLAAAEPTEEPRADTTLSYPDESLHGDALAVAEAVGLPERAVRRSAGVEEITLVVGADWREGATYPVGSEKPDDGERKAPKSADMLGGEDRGCMDVNPRYTW
ncbi:LytR family transcriptional regulator [Streptomyces sp. TRM43335]|uniref:LytR family transcriptional regulator n=1 Tax=Streptomyces taklimakanensis TaxID=2569853 RepID=A0A6G2BAL2_9ACTN|nr:LCP family protein [Streptomyces taklimakanensis]MTE19311.1 LytR family transcriptional regulator [Streptomyces taklimakanensis]